MKKIGIIVALIILTFSFSVKAEFFVEIDCNSKDVTNKSTITCEVNFAYEEIPISDIEFEYNTNLDIDFSSLAGFSLSKNGNIIAIHAATPLYEEMLDSTHIAKFTLKANDNCKEKESLTFKNIKLNKDSSLSVDNVTETFNIKLDSILDNDCFLNSITIDNVSVPDFDKNKLEYHDIVVNKNVVYINAVRSSEKASATGLGDVFIKPGETITHEIQVTAEDKTQKVYKLYITNTSEATELDDDTNSIGMGLSNDNTLKTLELYNGKEKIPFTFNNKKDTFDITIENSELKTITIKATTNHNKATFVDKFGPRSVDVYMGDNKIIIKVIAENKDEKTYTLKVNLQESKNSDNTLSSLKINDEVVKLIEDVDTYEIILPKDATKTKIEALPNNEKAKVEFKDIDLVDGKNTVVVTVIAENGTKKEYHIDITRSDKNILKDLKVDGYNLGFNKDEKNYVLKINKEDTKLKIIVSPSNIDYEILDNAELQDGSVIRIKVDDATGSKEYTIAIIKDTNKLSIVVYIIAILIAIASIVVAIYMIRKKIKRNINDDNIDVI